MDIEHTNNIIDEAHRNLEELEMILCSELSTEDQQTILEELHRLACRNA